MSSPEFRQSQPEFYDATVVGEVLGQFPEYEPYADGLRVIHNLASANRHPMGHEWSLNLLRPLTYRENLPGGKTQRLRAIYAELQTDHLEALEQTKALADDYLQMFPNSLLWVPFVPGIGRESHYITGVTIKAAAAYKHQEKYLTVVSGDETVEFVKPSELQCEATGFPLEIQAALRAASV